MLARSIPILLVILAEASVERDESNIVRIRKPVQKFVVATQIDVAIGRGAGQLDTRIYLACALTLRNRLLEHPPKPVGVTQLPMKFRMVRISRKGFPQQWHGL